MAISFAHDAHQYFFLSSLAYGIIDERYITLALMIMDDIEKLFNVKIDRARLQTLDPVEQSIQRLNLPMIRFRKVNTILNALKMQIEDGGDDPAANGYLVKALRASVIVQVGETVGKSVLEALDGFERSEQGRSQKLEDPHPKEMPKTWFDR